MYLIDNFEKEYEGAVLLNKVSISNQLPRAKPRKKRKAQWKKNKKQLLYKAYQNFKN